MGKAIFFSGCMLSVVYCMTAVKSAEETASMSDTTGEQEVDVPHQTEFPRPNGTGNLLKVPFKDPSENAESSQPLHGRSAYCTLNNTGTSSYSNSSDNLWNCNLTKCNYKDAGNTINHLTFLPSQCYLNGGIGCPCLGGVSPLPSNISEWIDGLFSNGFACRSSQNPAPQPICQTQGQFLTQPQFQQCLQLQPPQYIQQQLQFSQPQLPLIQLQWPQTCPPILQRCLFNISLTNDNFNEQQSPPQSLQCPPQPQQSVLVALPSTTQSFGCPFSSPCPCQ